MSTFNFTVRAIDDQDAYSDREFSINVKNTSIVKAVLADGSNVWTSTKPGTDAFIQRPSVTTSSISGGNPITYGNGIWIASNSSSYYTSLDGINWTPQSYPTYQASTYINDTGNAVPTSSVPLTNIRYNNGLFFYIVSYATSATTIGYMYAFSSTDGVKWTQFGVSMIGSPSVSNNNSPAIHQNFVYDGTDLYITTMSSAIASKTGYYRTYTSNAVTWKYVPVTDTAGTARSMSGIYFINGLWMLGTTGPTYLTSNDLVTWTVRTPSSSYISIGAQSAYMIYLNGSLILLFRNYVSSNWVYYVASSSDGINWTIQNGLSWSVQPSLAVNNGYLISTVVAKNAAYSNSTRDGVTWTAMSNFPTVTSIGFGAIS